MKKYHHIDNISIARFFNASSGDKKSVELSLRKRLNKDFSFKDYQDFFEFFQFNVPVCNVCKQEHVPFNFEISIDENTSQVIITDVIVIKKYQYCYAKSSHCKALSKGRKMNPNSSIFISLVMNLSDEDAKKWIRENNNSPFYRENFSNEDEYRSFQTRGLDRFIEMYGEEIGAERYKRMLEKQNHSRSLPGFIEKHGRLGEKLWKDYCARKDSMSLKFFETKNPDSDENEILEMWEKRHKSVGLSKEKFIMKHGEKAYHETYKKRTRKQFSFVSKWSLRMIERIKREVFPLLSEKEIQKTTYGKGKEFSIYDAERKKRYFYDFFTKVNNKRLIIEFNGHVFHADPRFENKKEKWKNPFNPQATWDEAFLYEKRKLETALSANCEILVVWDYESEDDIIKKSKDFFLRHCQDSYNDDIIEKRSSHEQ